jgi:hypothetical protein
VLVNRMGATYRSPEGLLHGRRLIASEAEYVGVGSPYTRNGDAIVLIFGMSALFILRGEPRHYPLSAPFEVMC